MFRSVTSFFVIFISDPNPLIDSLTRGFLYFRQWFDLYIQKNIYENFLDKIVNKAKKIKLGSPMDNATQMGPLNSFKQLENLNILDLISCRIGAEGASALAGGLPGSGITEL